MIKDFYKIALVGAAGRGKTYSLRNLDPSTTGYINVEKKPLPFINNFEFYATPNNWQEALAKLIEYAKEPKITQIVLDSFSAYQDSLLRSCRKAHKGFEIWAQYNMEIANLLELINLVKKEVIVLAHYDIVDVDGGSYSEKRIGVKGNEHNKVGVEKDFTIVLWGDVRRVDDKREFIFKLLTDGTTSAKTPPFLIEALGAEEVPNDMNHVLSTLRNTLAA